MINTFDTKKIKEGIKEGYEAARKYFENLSSLQRRY